MRLDGVARPSAGCSSASPCRSLGRLARRPLALGSLWLARRATARSARSTRAPKRRCGGATGWRRWASWPRRRPRGAQPAERHRHERAAAAARVPGDALPEGDGGPRGARELLDVVRAASPSGSTRIVQQFLDYARPPRLAPRSPACARPGWSCVAGAARRGARRAASRSSADVDRAPARRGRPRPAAAGLDNLLRNAIEATPAGGRVASARAAATAASL